MEKREEGSGIRDRERERMERRDSEFKARAGGWSQSTWTRGPGVVRGP